MTDSLRATSWPALNSLRPPEDQLAIERTFAGYRAMLETMSQAELVEHLSELSARIEAENRTRLESLISGQASELSRGLDTLVPRSTPMDRLTLRRVRGQAADSPRSPDPSPAIVRRKSESLGQRVATKLLAEELRRKEPR